MSEESIFKLRILLCIVKFVNLCKIQWGIAKLFYSIGKRCYMEADKMLFFSHEIYNIRLI